MKRIKEENALLSIPKDNSIKRSLVEAMFW